MTNLSIRRLAAFRVGGALLALAWMVAVVATVTGSSPPGGADTVPPAGVPATVSADPLPTVQVNGEIEKQVTVGNYVYAVGSFTSVRPPGEPAGTDEQPIADMVVFNITTGQLVPGYQHSLNAQGMAVTASPDGTKVFVGGDFTTVDGKSVGHAFAIETATGAVDPTFRPWINGRVQALAATNDEVFAGGQFTEADGNTATNLAALTESGTQVVWPASADNGIVTAMVMTPDDSHVIVGGRFTTLDGGHAAGGLGSLSATSGQVAPFAANQLIQDDGSGSAITTLSTDGTAIYGGGYVYESTNTPNTLEGTFSANPSTGAINWIDDCQGDTYGAYPVGQVLYSVNHAHDCQAIGGFTGPPTRRALAETTYRTGVNGPPETNYWSFQGQPDSSLLYWFPDLTPGNYDGADQAAYSVTGNSQYISLGGEFTASFGMAQQGLVRFAISSLAPDKIAPYPSSGLTPTATLNGTQANLSWQTTWDPDNEFLTYTVYRDGKAISSVKADSKYWAVQTVTYTDTNPPAGTHTYTVRASDPFNNGSVGSASNPVTVQGSAPPANGHDFQQKTSGLCLTSPASAGKPVTVTSCDGAAGGADQLWAWGSGTLETTTGHCLDASGTSAGSAVEVNACNGSSTQGWAMNSKNQVYQWSTGLCLDTPTATPASGTGAVLVSCSSATPWVQPAKTSLWAVTGTSQCLDGQTEAAGAAAVTEPCLAPPTAQNGRQDWTYWWNETLQVGSACLTSAGSTTGSAVDLASCTGATAEQWSVNSSGQWRQASSGLCLAPRSSPPASGGPVVLEPCSSTTEWTASDSG